VCRVPKETNFLIEAWSESLETALTIVSIWGSRLIIVGGWEKTAEHQQLAKIASKYAFI
jgi:hypothetical protein